MTYFQQMLQNQVHEKVRGVNNTQWLRLTNDTVLDYRIWNQVNNEMRKIVDIEMQRIADISLYIHSIILNGEEIR